jgi:hypothetical protein
VEDFFSSYNAILGRPCYAKFMAISNYTYLKLNMPGPNEIITVSTSFKATYNCEHANCEHTSLVATKELANLQKDMSQDAPDDPKINTSTFKSTEGTKEVPVDPFDPAKRVCIGVVLCNK